MDFLEFSVEQQLLVYLRSSFNLKKSRWLPRVITNIALPERELENET